ncbi:MAG: hypothetical protein AAF226_09535 [Verrucomicrobiota bacterium]
MSTKDIDDIFSPIKEMRKAIFEVGAKNGWERNWINDDVAGFISDIEPVYTEIDELKSLSNLKVVFPSADYILAMKCRAARAGSDDSPSHDLSDAISLCKGLGLRSKRDIETAIARFFPIDSLPDKSDFFINEIVSHLNE